MAEALIALGGNVGREHEVRDTLDRAIAALCDGAAVRLLARSSDYRTPPWGVTDQPAFINSVSPSQPMERVGGSIAAHVMAYMNGATIIRTHDVAETIQALRVVAALRKIK